MNDHGIFKRERKLIIYFYWYLYELKIDEVISSWLVNSHTFVTLTTTNWWPYKNSQFFGRQWQTASLFPPLTDWISQKLSYSSRHSFALKQQPVASAINLPPQYLIPAVSELVYDVLGKPSTTPYNDLKFPILKVIEEPKLAFTRRLHKELMNEVAKGPQS